MGITERGRRRGRICEVCDHCAARKGFSTTGIINKLVVMKISKNKYIILDRDGTLIEEKNYLHDPDQVSLYRELLGIKNLLQQDINLLCLQINRGSDAVISQSQICLLSTRGYPLSFQAKG